MDFVVPIKKMGLFTRAVLEGIEYCYLPPRIFIITNKEEIKNMENEMKKENWCVPKKVVWIEEETFFYENHKLKREDLEKVFEKERKLPYSLHREFGWWYQQLIKLGIFSQIPSISQKFVVWDGDLIPLEKWELFNSFNNSGSIAILQEESKSEFNKQQYNSYVDYLLGFPSKNPEPIGTFVTHHMVFDKDYLKEMIEFIKIRKQISDEIPWPLYFLSLCSDFYRFSEYILYSSFMLEFHSTDFLYYPFETYGKNGIRYREPKDIIQKIKESLPYSVNHSCFTYQEIKNYFSYERIPYVQMEHVYFI